MFGASVSELYLLIKSLINIGRTVDLCVITKKKYTRVHRNCESGLAIIYKHTGWSSTRCTEVMEMAWTDDNTLAVFFYMRYQ